MRIGHARARVRVRIVVKTRAPPRATDAKGPRTNSFAASEESRGGVRDTLNIYMGSKISVRSTLLKQDALGHLFCEISVASSRGPWGKSGRVLDGSIAGSFGGV